MVIAEFYNARYFKQHFTNFVDIVIGWMMEGQQDSRVKIHCSRVLQSFKLFWQNDAKFTLDLFGQLLEDMDGCIEKLTEEDEKTRINNFKEFASFLGKKKKLYFSSSSYCFFLFKRLPECNYQIHLHFI